ncbi:prolipoprotein diacylglyceryl transferase [Velocimicrobium porci]|uniref:Phosphatidylglycerol--prolipoprotein diacylglyceryl transferase n=1 Tax=Velocimicrobium porci TaxID=2606634 RepID=A0A6L5XX54_9FIRM|nr:prolipoprotein diacylglyceryl transferase [Velocimicrobium porci]MSS63041.1 prolipoprotein diacylglyceryl transferase [Velocimicrobium porci]
MTSIDYAADVAFPNLGISIEHLSSGFEIFGFRIAFYGMIIAFGMILGYLMATWQAKRTGQNPEVYLDFALLAIPLSVIGARIYYVIFSWDNYKDNLIEILNIRNGGLAIYGGVIVAILTAWLFCKYRKISFGLLADTGCTGLLAGQIIGRWGNFFNREAFGGYAGDSLFAMQLPWDEAILHMSSSSIESLKAHVVDNTILVHPTFLYESVWNIGVLILILVYTKHKKFDGELILLYLAGYGLGRIWIESLRTDQLLLWKTNIPISMLLSLILFVGALICIFVKRNCLKTVKE